MEWYEHRTAEYLVGALERLHEDYPCEENIEGQWCSRCYHMKSRIHDYLDTVPKWTLRIAIAAGWIKSPIRHWKFYRYQRNISQGGVGNE